MQFSPDLQIQQYSILLVFVTSEVSTTLPVLYIPHGGGPCFFMDWTMGPPDTWHRMAEWLRHVPELVGSSPQAILVISGQCEEEPLAVTSNPAPSLLYDYYGFPKHTYELNTRRRARPAWLRA